MPKQRVCGCTSGGGCQGECSRRPGCVCHGLAAELGREPTDGEVALALLEERERARFEGALGDSIQNLPDIVLACNLRGAAGYPVLRGLFAREMVYRMELPTSKGRRS